jgi:hypothetical protein
MDRKRLAAAFLIAATALAASGRAGVADFGRAATCRTASLVANVRSLSGFEILFGTVLTKMDPRVRRSAYRALAGPGHCPYAAAAPSRAAVSPNRPAARPARGSLA